ncbi:hypothetical protein BAUCODRAFT_235836 [Baudoinia panamericana UAMH 10762]|uniref:Uncharacterized protein n=1 Tax=Baudoinia panamericana (strain UAMH 10762) TaxID=717646 RepID=M2LGS5_BAUPA|nr:uncharacterized protein BAUCODRAFT_235836 [Baudoinia panamericana UAMH 10762]EMC93307.1 hypothetical protein BAUCODRAFT_235836 [Baudoinia panamericana UAMH 10762]
MDCFMEWQSKQSYFLAELDTTMDANALLNRFGAALGIGAALVVKKDAFRKIFQHHKDKVKEAVRIYSGSELLNSLTTRICVDLNRGFSRGEVLDVVLKEMHGKAEQALEQDVPCTAKRHATVKADAVVTDLNLLQTFKNSDVDSELELYFDYAGFCNRCVLLLKSVKFPVTPPHQAKKGMTEDPVYIGLHLLDEARQLEKARRPMDDSGLALLARQVQKYVVKHEDDCIQAAKQRSSGNTPASDHSMLSKSARKHDQQ